MRIVIETVDHKDQRYPTLGDWYWTLLDKPWQPDRPEMFHANIPDEAVLHVRVSRLGNRRHEMLVAFHEIDEAMGCLMNGITEGEVDHFDKEFEQHRQPGDLSEPGDSSLAPYRHEHRFASALEALRAEHWHVNWDQYTYLADLAERPPAEPTQ